MTVAPDRRVFVALDTDDLARAQRLAAGLEGVVGGFKIGLQLFGRHGVEGLSAFLDAAARRAAS